MTESIFGVLAMPRGILLTLFAIAVTAMPVRAADLAARSGIGAIFGEPAKPSRSAKTSPPTQEAEDNPFFGYAPEVDVEAKVTGYYGKPNSYYYTPYYGSKASSWDDRLPYACGFYGYC
jgi:hypothetical protein